ncbi:MAG: serine/threonine-protein phosphatase [Flavobacteriales bacterium]|nr:serine/threonine-protein phosphatase [Flavobacteriales bacterium]
MLKATHRDIKKLLLIICCIIMVFFAKANKVNYTNQRCEQLHDSLYDLCEEYYLINSEKSKFYANELLKLAKNCKDSQIYFSAYYQMSWAALSLSDFPEAVRNAEKSLEVAEFLSDKSNLINANNLLGNVYLEIPDKDYALKAFNNGIKVAKEIKDNSSLSMLYNNVAIAFEHFNNLDTALQYYYLSHKLLSKDVSKRDFGLIYLNIGDLHFQLANIDSANYYTNKSREFLEIDNDKDLLFIYYLNTALIFSKSNSHQTAKQYLDSCYLTITEGTSPTDIKTFFDYKSQVLFTASEYKNAYHFLLKAYNLQDSILSEEVYNKLRDIKITAVAEKKEAEIQQHLQENKILELEIAENKASRKIFYLVAILASIVFLFFGFMFYYTRKNNRRLKKRNAIIESQSIDIKKKNNQLELKNKEVTDSITYAKRIQEAILPSRYSLTEKLKNGFVLYQPKDIVSGDFYWLESPLTNNKEEKDIVYFAACDCTGHGVPGAMVSVICANSLSKALLEDNISEPGKLLDRTRELVLQRFEKSGEDVKDGMDIAICSLLLSESYATLQYAGANSPLYIVTKNTESIAELIEIKPNKQPIGKIDNPMPFTTHTLSLKKGDIIYVFTDGYADQFGGPKGKKMMYKPFRNLLLSIYDKPMDEQKEILEQHFYDWKGSLEQVDDVCIIGVRI